MIGAFRCKMFRDLSRIFVCLGVAALLLAGCTQAPERVSVTGPTSLKQVPAVRLNYRYEADVPAPNDTRRRSVEERNAAVQQDFDQNRLNELLDKTITSPDGKRVLAVWHFPTDVQAQFRLDMYSAEGQLLKKVTPDAMAVHFPDTIVWSPDSSTVAFVAMTRGMTAPLVRIADVVEPVGTVDPGASPDTRFNYIDISSVDNRSKFIRAPAMVLSFGWNA